MKIFNPGLRQRTLQVPIKPNIQSHLDTSNFDEYPMDQDGAPPDDVSGWDEHFQNASRHVVADTRLHKPAQQSHYFTYLLFINSYLFTMCWQIAQNYSTVIVYIYYLINISKFGRSFSEMKHHFPLLSANLQFLNICKIFNICIRYSPICCFYFCLKFNAFILIQF